MANFAGHYSTGVFILALLTTIAFQVTSNFANDYGDGVRGTDDDTREGPKRVLQSGLLGKSALKKGVYVSAGISIILSAILIHMAFPSNAWLYILVFFLLGLLSVWAAIRYTMGSSPYGYKGMGDIFVFIFFGLLSVMGTLFLNTKSISFIAILPAISIGLLCVGVLNLNNLRDVKSDRRHGKKTLVVQMGFDKGKRYHYFLLITAFVAFLIYGIVAGLGLLTLIYLFPFVLIFVHLNKVRVTKDAKMLDPELKKLALSTFFAALLFYISINYFL